MAKNKRQDGCVAKSSARLLRALFVMLGLASGCFWHLKPAEACSAPASGVHDREVQPKDKATGVPINGRVLVFYSHGTFEGSGLPEGESISLKDPNDNVIAASVASMNTGDAPQQRKVFVLTPTQALAANTTYRVFSKLKAIPCGGRGGAACEVSGEHEISSFTTGASADTTAPTFAGAKELLCGTTSSCGDGACCGPYKRSSFSMTWDEATDDNATFAVRYNVYNQSDLTKPLLPLVTMRGVMGYIYHSGGEHFPDWRKLTASSGDGFVVRAVDLAGNEDTNAKAVVLNSFCQMPVESVEEPSPTPDGGGGDASQEPTPTPDASLEPAATPDASLEPTATPEKTSDTALVADRQPQPDTSPKQMGCQLSNGGPVGGFGLLLFLCLCLCILRRERRGTLG